MQQKATPSFLRYLWPLYKLLLRFVPLPILVGPWHGEVGFEALYWLPFLAHLRHETGIPRDRFIPIARGGTALWYDTPTGVELHAMRTSQDVRIENWLAHNRTGWMKQYQVSDFDRSIIKDAAKTLGLRWYWPLHPKWMYQTLTPFWGGHKGIQWLSDRVRFAGIPAPQMNGVTLPENYVAVKFYFRSTFPPNMANRSFCEQTIRKIAATHPVIVVDSGVHADDHIDYLPKDRTNVQILSQIVPMTAENNLAIQSAVMAKATGVVGTYGGMTQMASRMGVPTFCYYSEWHSVCIAHKHLSETLALQMRVPFVVSNVNELPIQQAIQPQVVRSS